nr:hypothetical protein Iba_chr14dCG2450 [Ipomoea batatas]GMD92065.1 hypothetical protein Iba_chr14eCG5510 [Ipomoea batatas]
MQLGVPLSSSTPYTIGITGLSDATALPASLGIARDTTPVSASVGVQPSSPAVVLEAPSRTPVEASRVGSGVELRPITHPTAQGSSTTAESGNAGLQDAGMAETDTVATSVESPDSSHGGSTQAASSQVAALPLRRSQRSRRVNPKYFVMGVQRRVRRLARKVSPVSSVGFLDSLMSFIFCSEVGRWSTLFPGGGDLLHSHRPSSVLDLGYRLLS